MRGLLNSLKYPERRRIKSLLRFAALGLLPADQRERALARNKAAVPLPLRLEMAVRDMGVDAAGLLMPCLVALGPALWPILALLELCLLLCGSVASLFGAR